MADLFDDPDQYDDIPVRIGCDLVWGFSLEPWNADGTTAVFRINDTDDFDVTIEVTGEGVDSVSEFSVHLTPAQLATLGLDVRGVIKNYVVLETMADDSVIPIGNGSVMAV